MKIFKHLKLLFLIVFSVAISHFDALAYSFEVDGIYYNYSGNNNVEVTDDDENFTYYFGNVLIPETVTYNGTTYSVTSIGNSTFFGCSGLTSVTIPNSVTSIGDYAFSYCESLTSVTIPNSVTSIGEAAFSACHGLTSFNGKYASEDHRCLIVDGELNSFAPAGLKEYTIPNSVTSIGDYAFYRCSSLTSITIPNSVTSISDAAFQYCSGLTSVVIPNSVTSIGDFAFQVCSGLTSVTIPNSVTSIGDSAFSYCESLTSVTIPNSVTSIGGWAFSHCESLTSVTIPNSVTSIGYLAFWDCRGLTSVTVENPDPININLGDYVFYNVPTNTCTLYVPKGSKELYRNVSPWWNFANIEEKEFGAESVPGDFDGNGSTSVGDLQMMINSILSSTSDIRFDLTGDGDVNAADIAKMIDIVMGR